MMHNNLTFSKHRPGTKFIKDVVLGTIERDESNQRRGPTIHLSEDLQFD